MSTCPDCNGTGVIVFPAHQRGGEVVDEERIPCTCQLNFETDYLSTAPSVYTPPKWYNPKDGKHNNHNNPFTEEEI